MTDAFDRHLGRLHCPRCQLVIGYETRPGDGRKGPATFLLPGARWLLSRRYLFLTIFVSMKGAMTDTQSKVPADAFGEETTA